MRTSITLSSNKNKISAVVVQSWALLVLVVSMDLFLVSSAAFLFERKQYSHPRSIASAPEHCRNYFPGLLRYGGIDDTDDDGHSSLGTNSSGTPDSLTPPLPTSNDSMTPEEVVTTCMTYLQGKGDISTLMEEELAGLEICYNFSSDSCRMANGGSLESFLQRANNPVFRTMVGCARWEVVNVGPTIVGTATRGSMQTVLIGVVPRFGEKGDTQQRYRNDRQFLWTIVKERRPPRQGHCLVYECVSVENAFAHTL